MVVRAGLPNCHLKDSLSMPTAGTGPAAPYGPIADRVASLKETAEARYAEYARLRGAGTPARDAITTISLGKSRMHVHERRYRKARGMPPPARGRPAKAITPELPDNGGQPC